VPKGALWPRKTQLQFQTPEGWIQAMTSDLMIVRANWDDEASVWVATSDDIVGLVTEADSLEALTEKLKAIIPELLELNGSASTLREIPVHIIAGETIKVLNPRVTA
jgi:predicted RNase H-like HicB family nuclease